MLKLVFQSAQQTVQRVKQQECDGKVADAVNNVEGNACCPPCKRGSDSACKEVGDGAQQPKEHTEDPCKQCGRYRTRFSVPSHEKYGTAKDRPHIEIRKPPQAEAVDQSFQNDEYIEDEPDMAAEYEGIQNQQERYQLDIGKPGKADLQHQKDCGKKRVTDKFLCFHVVPLLSKETAAPLLVRRCIYNTVIFAVFDGLHADAVVAGFMI